MEKKKKIIYMTLLLLVLIQAGYLVYTFTFRRVGCFSDEVWSYGLSNSFYQPFLYLEDGISYNDADLDILINIDQWVQGSVFQEYLTVQPGERFAYLSVYHNQALDCHPPLYYMLLHTVCSFFPNRFSWWYGLSLNLALFVGTQVFLFLASKELTGKDEAGLLACLLYGGGTGMLCTFAFIRQYGLLTMLCMAFTYWGICLYRQKSKGARFEKKTLAAASVTAFLAFLTHYYSIAYIGVFTALFCIYLLCKRQIKQMFLYGGSILGALALAFAVFPAALSHIAHRESESVKLYSTATQIRMLLSRMYTNNFGFTTSYFATAFWNITIPLVIAAIVFAVMILFPFRDEPWFAVLMGKLKGLPRKLLHFLRVMNYMPIFILAGGFSIYIVTALSVDVWLNGAFCMRYIALSFPLFCMLAVVAAYWLLTRFSWTRKYAAGILFVLVVVIVIRVQVTTDYPYSQERYGFTGDMAELTRGKRVVVVNTVRGYVPMLLTSFSIDLRNTEESFHTSPSIARQVWQDVDRPDKRVDYVFVDTVVYQPSAEEIQRIMQWFGGEESQDIFEVVVDEEAEEQKQEENDCTELIRELAGERGYEMKGMVTVQGGTYYMLELQ